MTLYQEGKERFKAAVKQGFSNVGQRLMAPPKQRQAPVKPTPAQKMAQVRAMKSYKSQNKTGKVMGRAARAILPMQGFSGRQYYAPSRAPQQRMQSRPTQSSRPVPPQFQRRVMQAQNVQYQNQGQGRQMREVVPVFRSNGGKLGHEVDRNGPLPQNPNGNYYVVTDAFSGRRIIKMRPVAETWIAP